MCPPISPDYYYDGQGNVTSFQGDIHHNVNADRIAIRSVSMVVENIDKIVLARIITVKELYYIDRYNEFKKAYELSLIVEKSWKGSDDNFKILTTETDFAFDNFQKYIFLARKTSLRNEKENYNSNSKINSDYLTFVKGIGLVKKKKNDTNKTIERLGSLFDKYEYYSYADYQMVYPLDESVSEQDSDWLVLKKYPINYSVMLPEQARYTTGNSPKFLKNAIQSQPESYKLISLDDFIKALELR